MPDALILHPGAQHGIYGPLGNELTAIEPPIWARMICGWLRQRGYQVDIVDQEASGLSAEDVATCIDNTRLIVIAVFGHQPSASTQQMASAGEVARAIKARLPSQEIIMVGNHPSALPVRTLREEAVDYVCDGEGPLTIKGLLDGAPLEQIPGLVWRDNDVTIRQNALAPLLDIDELGGDVWDSLPMDRYRAHNWQVLGDFSRRQPYASIYTTLGCSFRCSFCMINVFQHSNRYRRRDPDKVVQQVELLHNRYGVSTIKFADEMFVLTPSHYLAICDGLAKRGLGEKLNIWAYSRVDTVRADYLAALRAGGVRWLALGIESGSKHVRDGAQKALRTEDIVGTVKAIQDAGINVIGNFMFGLRDDDYSTMSQTLALALECMPDWANFYSTMAYPGSALYEQALANEWTLPSSWRGYSQHNDDCRPLDTEYLTGQEVLGFRDNAFLSFFGDQNYLHHVATKFGREAREHVEGILGYKLKRKLTGVV